MERVKLILYHGLGEYLIQIGWRVSCLFRHLHENGVIAVINLGVLF